MIGQTVSHYRILEKLGEGGMGVVYKAQDTTLDRTVALKFIAANLIKDADARKRFEREAKAAAGVSHANVCHVYQIAEAEGHSFLAMEFVEGESLDRRIERGPLALKDALEFARQTAEGLAAAHEQGVVHRDVKPGNLLITPKGQVKILDFGLALLTEGSKLTQLDTKVGTVAYMSPEQAQGMEVDHRTDIWALGCVIYEMVCGQRPFPGAYDQALLYEIVNQEPEPLTAVRAGVPMELEVFVGKCLAKDAADRYDSAAELAKDLRTLGEKLKSGRSTVLRTTGLSAAALAPAAQAPSPFFAPRPSSPRILLAVVAILTLALLGLSAVHFSQAPPEKPVARFSFTPEGLEPAPTAGKASISPDGKHIFYVARAGGEWNLWLRSLSDETVRRVPGTEGAIGGFWSPDSSSIGFAAGESNFELKRVSIDGSNLATLCRLPPQENRVFFGGSWSPDGELIVFTAGVQLYEVAARGGQPRLLFERPSDRPSSSEPHFLPSGGGPRALIYDSSTSPLDPRLAVLNLETGERRDLGPGNRPVYSRDGYLIFGLEGFNERGLWALPFSRKTLEPSGPAFPISTDGTVASVSNGGALAYIDDAGATGGEILVWRNRAGERLESLGEAQRIFAPALSPDGNRIAAGFEESGSRDIWIHDLIRATKTRFTFEDQWAQQPVWSPAGRQVVYLVFGEGQASRLMRKAADGTGEAIALVESEFRKGSPDWSRDGRYLVYQENHAGTGWDILYLELQDGDGASAPVTFLASDASERNPSLSPDSRFLAYTSNESGRYEIYVRPFPGGEGKWQVSLGGGRGARWRRDGVELYYVSGSTLMAVPVSTDSGFTFGQPQVLFESPRIGGGFDVSADGERFLMVSALEGAEAVPPRIRVVLNWLEEFRDREKN